MSKKTVAWTACFIFSLVSGMPMAQAQAAYPPPPAAYTQEQLDQMLAPVALYPDSLLAQVLMAATYPLEVVQAQRFVEARPGLQGDGLSRAVAPMPWDPSVKALVQFPAVLAMMNDRLDWMQQLGQAFLSQQATVMDTVQQLRERAQLAGSLQSSPQQRVLAEEGAIVIEPVDPQVVYVPYYNPVVVYGNWWWPSHPPVVWTPPPRYRPPHYSPGVTASISFGSGIGVLRASFGDARPDWRQRQVMVTRTRITNVTTTNNVTVNRNVTVNQHPVAWHHDARYGSGRYPQQAQAQRVQASIPAQPAPQARPAPQAQAQAAPVQRVERGDERRPDRPAPSAATAQQRVIQEDQARQRQTQEQQRQREQQVNEQQRQREQMVHDQQRQREQQAHEQRQQQVPQRQVQVQQPQREQQVHEQQARQQQAQEQPQRQTQQVHQQQEQARREQQQRPEQQRNDRRDDKS
jgi:DNA segregation ATPase FtsK/SpoIIIE-like protein